MAIDQNLGVFISWSGELARRCTKVLRDWLPKMFDHVDPWMSDVDIQPGDRSMDEIQSKLNECGFGIIVVTTENMDNPWLNFEAGALSKSFGDAKSRVVPLLVNIGDMYQLKGPISQFQATMLDKAGVAKLCDSISLVIGLDLPTMRARFEWAWPDLEAGITNATAAAGQQPELPAVDSKDLLRDMYAMIRSLQESQLRLEEGINRKPPRNIRVHTGPVPIPRNSRVSLVKAIASETMPVEDVSVRRGEPGDPPDIVVTFEDGRHPSSEEYNQIYHRLKEVMDVNFRLVIG